MQESNSPIILNYEGNPISFDLNNKFKMVNATEMGKIFDKTPKDFLRNQKIKDYIVALASRQNCLVTDLQIVILGGESPGTWMERKLALRFAQWLNADFAVWVDMKIEELLITGHTSIQPKSDRELVIIGLEAANREIKKLEQENKVLTKEVQELTPDAEFARRLKDSPELNSMLQVSAVLRFKNMGEQKLFEFLRTEKILMELAPNKNIPYRQYIEKGFFEVKVITRNKKNFRTTRVTKRGIQYIYKRLRKAKRLMIGETEIFKNS